MDISDGQRCGLQRLAPPARRLEIGRDRAHRRSTRRMFTFVVRDQPYRSLADLSREIAVLPMMAPPI